MVRVSFGRYAVLTFAILGVSVATQTLAGSVDRPRTQAEYTGENFQPDPAELVASMSRALKSLNYEGTFVHIQGNHVSSMSILHSSGESGELEKLWALDGEAREVIRNDSVVTCIWPASRSVVVSRSKSRDILPGVNADLVDNERYRFSMDRPDRVAGMPVHVVNVTPADTFRYGYRFWIDQGTHMLLRSMLLDGQRTVEQVMFTRIEYPAYIDPARFDIMRDKQDADWLKPRQEAATSGLSVRENDEVQVDRVGFGQLPDGYHEVSETYVQKSRKRGAVSHVVLSDGMASVSVYVEYAHADSHPETSEGLSSMGAMNAFSLRRDDDYITAVGEVPAETVKAIADATRVN